MKIHTKPSRIYNKWLKCNNCGEDFDSKNGKIYDISIKEIIFIEDSECEYTGKERYLQLCKNCFESVSINKVLIIEGREFR